MYQSLGQLKETKVFKDPVHRYIYVSDQLIWQLIGTKEFQRLRRIKQLYRHDLKERNICINH